MKFQHVSEMINKYLEPNIVYNIIKYNNKSDNIKEHIFTKKVTNQNDITSEDKSSKSNENITEEPVIIDIKKKVKIKKDIKKIKAVLNNLVEIKNDPNMCMVCNKYSRTNSSFCNICATPA